MRRDTKQHPNLSVWNEEEFETLAMKEEQLPETYRSPSIPIEECSLRVVDGPHKGEELKLESDIYHIGRADWCDLCLVQDKWVSGHHCIIYVGTDGVQVRDKGSRNGIFLGGHRVFDALLTPGSLLRVGESVLEVYSTHTQTVFSGAGARWIAPIPPSLKVWWDSVAEPARCTAAGAGTRPPPQSRRPSTS